MLRVLKQPLVGGTPICTFGSERYGFGRTVTGLAKVWRRAFRHKLPYLTRTMTSVLACLVVSSRCIRLSLTVPFLGLSGATSQKLYHEVVESVATFDVGNVACIWQHFNPYISYQSDVLIALLRRQ